MNASAEPLAPSPARQARRLARGRHGWFRADDLHRGALAAAAAAVFLVVGLLFMQERIELVLQAAGAGVALALVWSLTR